jgi:TetR/AcrR family transcriptional regulator, ethionamide resistance regulator
VPPGSRKTAERRSRKRDANTAKLLEGVERLLAEGYSYTDVSIDEISAASGVARSTLYYYFKDKGEILLAIGAEAIAEIDAASRGWGEVDPLLSREEFLETVRQALETWRPHVPIINAMAEAAAYTPEVDAAFRAGWATVEERIAEHIRDGQAAGRIRPSISAQDSAGWLMWMLERGMSQLIGREGDAARSARLIDVAAEILYTVLYPDS